MYKSIARHPGTRKLYADKLVAQGVLDADGPDAMVREFRAAMDEGRLAADPVLTNFKRKFAVDWTPFLNRKWTDAAETALPRDELRRLAERVTSVPETFKLHPLVQKVMTDRAAMGRGEVNVDWGMGEMLAYASLVAGGYGGACRPGPGAVPSPTATRYCTTRAARVVRHGCRCRTSPTTSVLVIIDSLLPRKPCSPSSTATPAPSRTR